MFCAEIDDKSTVIDLEDTDSSPLELVNSKSTTGALSLSVMVKVWTLSLPNVALLGFDKVTITVSFASSRESSTMLAMVIVPDVDPAFIVSVPLARV